MQNLYQPTQALTWRNRPVALRCVADTPYRSMASTQITHATQNPANRTRACEACAGPSGAWRIAGDSGRDLCVVSGSESWFRFRVTG